MTTMLYLGTEEGIVALKKNGEGEWKVESHGLKDWSVSEVAAVPSSPNRVLAGTRGDGVWSSEDFGKTWRKPSYGTRGPGKVRCMAFHPQSPELMYAGTEPIDLFVSENLGRSWSRIGSVWDVPWVETVDYPVKTVEPHVRDIAIDPNDPRTIYIALQVGYMLKTTNGGESWTLLDKQVDADVHTILVNPKNSSNLFVATGGHDCRKGIVQGKALYETKNGGETWAPMALDFSQEYSVPLAMHPTDPDVLFSAVANGQPSQWRRPSGAEALMIKSTDGGKHWQKLENGPADLGKDFSEAIVFDPDHPGHLYAAFRKSGVYASEDEGDSWTKVAVDVPSVSDMKCVHA